MIGVVEIVFYVSVYFCDCSFTRQLFSLVVAGFFVFVRRYTLLSFQ